MWRRGPKALRLIHECLAAHCGPADPLTTPGTYRSGVARLSASFAPVDRTFECLASHAIASPAPEVHTRQAFCNGRFTSREQAFLNHRDRAACASFGSLRTRPSSARHRRTHLLKSRTISTFPWIQREGIGPPLGSSVWISSGVDVTQRTTSSILLLYLGYRQPCPSCPWHPR